MGNTDIVYVGSYDGTFYAINPDSTVRWTFKTTTPLHMPAMNDSGVVYIGGKDGRLFAIQTESKGLADSPWPKYMHDNQNTGNVLYVTTIERQPPINLPKAFTLLAPYPNPFNARIYIRFNLTNNARVVIDVFNLQGQHIAQLLNKNQQPGTHKILWNAAHVPSGVYFIQLKTEYGVKKESVC